MNQYMRSRFLILLMLLMLMENTVMAMTHQPPALQHDPKIEKVIKTNQEWEKILTPEQFRVLRKKGTEKSFSGQYDKFFQPGIYLCAACGNPLFSSKAKFDSGTGWPSFWEPLSSKSIDTKKDWSLFLIPRTEVVCHRCGGHLGHVFDDGPQPTGLRYCMNSIALTFKSID